MWGAYQENTVITMYFTTPNKSKTNQTPQEPPRCTAQRGHKRAIVLKKGKKKKRGRSKEKKHSFTCVAPPEVCMPSLLGARVSLK